MNDIPREKFLKFIKWLNEEYSHPNPDNLMFSESYLSGRVDAFDEVLDYLDRMDCNE